MGTMTGNSPKNDHHENLNQEYYTATGDTEGWETNTPAVKKAGMTNPLETGESETETRTPNTMGTPEPNPTEITMTEYWKSLSTVQTDTTVTMPQQYRARTSKDPEIRT